MPPCTDDTTSGADLDLVVAIFSRQGIDKLSFTGIISSESNNGIIKGRSYRIG